MWSDGLDGILDGQRQPGEPGVPSSFVRVTSGGETVVDVGLIELAG